MEPVEAAEAASFGECGNHAGGFEERGGSDAAVVGDASSTAPFLEGYDAVELLELWELESFVFE